MQIKNNGPDDERFEMIDNDTPEYRASPPNKSDVTIISIAIFLMIVMVFIVAYAYYNKS